MLLLLVAVPVFAVAQTADSPGPAPSVSAILLAGNADGRPENPAPTMREKIKDALSNISRRLSTPNAAQARLTEIKQELNETLLRIRQLKASGGNVTPEQKQELAERADFFLIASIDARIKVAESFAMRGASNATVNEFIAYAQAQALAINATSNMTQKRGLVKEFNTEWMEFRKTLAKEMLAKKIAIAAQKGVEHYQELNKMVSKLKERGYDTSKLEAIAEKVQARFEAAKDATTLKSAMWRLKYAYRGLVFLRAAIQKTINSAGIGELPEEAEPASFEADVPVLLLADVAA